MPPRGDSNGVELAGQLQHGSTRRARSDGAIRGVVVPACGFELCLHHRSGCSLLVAGAAQPRDEGRPFSARVSVPVAMVLTVASRQPSRLSRLNFVIQCSRTDRPFFLLGGKPQPARWRSGRRRSHAFARARTSQSLGPSAHGVVPGAQCGCASTAEKNHGWAGRHEGEEFRFHVQHPCFYNSPFVPRKLRFFAERKATHSKHPTNLTITTVTFSYRSDSRKPI